MKLRVVRGWIALSVLAGFALLAVWLGQLATAATSENLQVSFLDVGQGDATLLDFPDGTQVLIDGGSYRSVDRSLSEVLPFYDRSLDVVVATHADSDHIGGLVSVLKEYEVDRVIVPSQPSNTSAYRAFRGAVAAEVDDGAKVQEFHRGDIISFGDSGYLHGLFPIAGHVPEDTNDSSLVFMLTYGQTRWLFTGDSSQAIEEFLASHDGGNLNADVLKVGHHGSRSSSDAAFLSAASPALAVISAGSDNPYGHPAPEVVGRIISMGAEVVCTCEVGTITLKSDGRSVSKVQ